MSGEFRRHARVMTFIPAGIHFTDGALREGWGRIRNLSVGGLELETHFPLKSGQKIYLTFAVDGFYQFQRVPSRVIRARVGAGIVSAGVAFDEQLDREHLRQAIVYLIDRV